MLSKHLTMALLGSALICAPAMAQTSSTTGAPAATAPAAGSTMTHMQPGQWRASKIEGLDVYNNNNEKIGDISEMLVDSSGKIQAVVIGVGGFLGIGERDVAIPFEQVRFVNEPRANTAATSTTTGAPASGGMASSTTMNTSPNTTGSTATGTTASGSMATDNANRTAPDHAMVDMTKDQLKSMAEFRYNR